MQDATAHFPNDDFAFCRGPFVLRHCALVPEADRGKKTKEEYNKRVLYAAGCMAKDTSKPKLVGIVTV